MKDRTQLIQLSAGVVSLVALLAYTLSHTGALLASYAQWAPFGYVAAFGVEMSIVALSIRIGQLRKTNQGQGFFFFVLVAVVTISAMANIAEGYHIRYDQQLTLDTVGSLDWLQAAIGVSATGLISLIVLALAEILGTDVTTAVKAMGRQMSKTPAFVPGDPEQLDKANEAKRTRQTERRDKVMELLQAGQKPKDIAQTLQVSVKTIDRDIKASANGKG